VRSFDYPRFAEPLREPVGERAAALAAEAGIAIEHIGKKHVRKEAVVTKVLEGRGEHPGLVPIISAMEGSLAIVHRVLMPSSRWTIATCAPRVERPAIAVVGVRIRHGRPRMLNQYGCVLALLA
jgi:hypothetical protein